MTGGTGNNGSTMVVLRSGPLSPSHGLPGSTLYGPLVVVGRSGTGSPWFAPRLRSVSEMVASIDRNTLAEPPMVERIDESGNGNVGTKPVSSMRSGVDSPRYCSTGRRARRSAMRSSRLVSRMSDPTWPRASMRRSISTSCGRCSSRTATPAGSSSSAAWICSRWSLARAVMRLTPSSAAVMLSRCRLSPAMSSSADRRVSVSPSSRPSVALRSSATIGCSWSTPPPLSSSDRAPRTCSMSVAVRVLDVEMTSPSAS